MIKLVKKFLLLFIFFLPISCSIEPGKSNAGGILSSQVQVVVFPYGTKDNIRPSNPIIFTSSGSYPCRPRPASIRSFYDSLDKNTVSDTGFANIFGISKNTVEVLKGVEVNNRQLNQLGAIKESVGGNGTGWLKFGLFINNANRGFFLIVDSVSYVATATYQNQPFIHQGDIQSGYCSGSGSGSVAGSQNSDSNQNESLASVNVGNSFLYIIPPITSITYKPTSVNPFHNLTIYLQGLPIINRINDPAFDQQKRLDNLSQNQSSGLNNNHLSGRFNHANTANGGTAVRRNPRDPLIVIPRYTVDLTLGGYFVTAEGDPIASFAKRVRFFTQSSYDF